MSHIESHDGYEVRVSDIHPSKFNTSKDVVTVTVDPVDENDFSYEFTALGDTTVRFPESLTYPGSEYYEEIASAVKMAGFAPYTPRTA